MNVPLGPSRLALVVLSAALIAGGEARLARSQETQETPSIKPEEAVAAGREIFTRHWGRHKAEEKRDGVGPVFNDVSCAACHNQGGLGGGGEAEKNAELLSLIHPPRQAARGLPEPIRRRAENVHRGFSVGATTVILHRFGRGKDGSTDEYADWRKRFVPETQFGADPATQQRVRLEGLQFLRTQRNTPALYGAGVIDSIPDTVLIETAEKQAKQFPGISGRVPQTATGAVGRFGWRGQTSTLHDFVIDACANELGLRVPGRVPPGNPLQGTTVIMDTSAGRTFTDIASFGGVNRDLDLTEDQCKALTAFVASLPAPRQVSQLHLEDAKDVLKGEKLFQAIGCAACHMRDLGPANGIYSDLLLHEMGPALADPAPAVPELSRTEPDAGPLERLSMFGGGSYFGGPVLKDPLVKVRTRIHQEWRTPPLWGVRDSAPYLHDGRAATIEEAVRWHGGEAHRSARKFRALGRAERVLVLQFLNSLAAPGTGPNDGMPHQWIELLSAPGGKAEPPDFGFGGVSAFSGGGGFGTSVSQ